jgi:hypothetical protein
MVLSLVSLFVQVSLDFQVSLPDSMGFVPMQFYLALGAVWQTNRSDSLYLSPTTATIRLAQIRANLNTRPARNDFSTSNRADYLEFHAAK